MKKLVLALILFTFMALPTPIDTPVHAQGVGQTHLDGRNGQYPNGPSGTLICDDFGGTTNLWGTDVGCNGAPWQTIFREWGSPEEFRVADPATCATFGFCTSNSNLVGTVQTFLHSMLGGAICASDPAGIDGIVGPHTRDLIHLFNTVYLGQPGNYMFSNDGWRYFGTRVFWNGTPDTQVVDGAVWDFNMLHESDHSFFQNPYLIIVPFDGGHGTNYNARDAGYGPNC